MTRITVYAIMRNEERNIPEWYRSASEADDVVVLDTGSVDRTIQSLRDLGALVYSEPWPGAFDFAAARNMALQLIPGGTDLAVWLDADERLSAGWRDEIERDPDHLAMQMLLDSQGGQSWRTHPRTNVHNPHTHRWRYPVHEELIGPEPTRKLASRVYLDNTHRRNHAWIDALVAAVADFPDSARMHFYLGRDLLLHGSEVEARRMLLRCVVLHGNKVHQAEAMRLLYDITGDVSWLHRALDLMPARREAWVDLCLRQHKYGLTSDALVTWEAAAARDDEWLWTTFWYAWDGAFQQLGRDVGAL